MFAGAVCLTLRLSVPACAQCAYELTVFDAPDCNGIGSAEVVHAISDDGVCVGTYTDCSGQKHAFICSVGRGLETLPALAGAKSCSALDVASGTVVGAALTVSGQLQNTPLVWVGLDVSVIVLPGPAVDGWATAVNSQGEVAGYWSDNLGGPYPFEIIKGVFNDLRAALPRPWLTGMSFALSSNGNCAGRMDDDTFMGTRGFVRVWGFWAEVTPVEKGKRTFAFDVNDEGLAVGRAEVTLAQGKKALVFRPIVWTLAAGTSELPLLPNRNQGSAWGVSPYGQVVGQVQKKSPTNGSLSDTAGVAWIDGKPVELMSLVRPTAGLVAILDARAINERHEIAVQLTFENHAAIGILKPIANQAADLVVDCRVDARDLEKLLNLWGTVYGSPGGLGDLDGDGNVGPMDLGILLGEWEPS